MAATALSIDHFIAMDWQAIRLRLLLGAALIALGGLLAFGAVNALPIEGDKYMDFAGKAVGLITSLTGLYPFNDSWVRWERIKTLAAIRQQPGLLEQSFVEDMIKALYKKEDMIKALYKKYVGV